jgi:hypothetical protein
MRHHIDLVTPTVNLIRGRPKEPRISKRSIEATKAIFRGPKTNGLALFFHDVTKTQNIIFLGKILAADSPMLNTTNCGSVITPDCLQALYNITRTPTQTNKKSFAIRKL